MNYSVAKAIESNIWVNHAAGVLDPSGWFRRMNRIESDSRPWTRASGALFISFDCDTHEDAAVLPLLAQLLNDHGFKGSFGVIGQLVRDDPGAYREVAAAGHEIFAHGNRYHTEKTGDTYRADFDYSQLSWPEVEDEIREARATITDTLQVPCSGFRTPHFGSFQSSEQLGGLHRLLSRYGYAYSSSALMWHARRNGFLFGASPEGIYEFPLSSAPGPPISLIDSYNYIVRDRQRGRAPRLPDKWTRALQAVHAATSGCIYLNVYFDPHHVATWRPFIGMLEAAAELHRAGRLWSGTYSDALSGVSRGADPGETPAK